MRGVSARSLRGSRSLANDTPRRRSQALERRQPPPLVAPRGRRRLSVDGVGDFRRLSGRSRDRVRLFRGV